MRSQICVSFLLLVLIAHTSSGLKEEDCEVCVKTVRRFASSLDDATLKNQKLIGEAFKKFCKSLKQKEERFCYYLGGHDQSATGILNELTQPLSSFMPAEKVCEKLKKKDVQICELRYEKQIDVNSVDLKKLKVRDLKKILSDWDETCDGCIEKTDYINRIEQLKPKHARQEL